MALRAHLQGVAAALLVVTQRNHLAFLVTTFKRLTGLLELEAVPAALAAHLPLPAELILLPQ
jgi:hypothetical protein